MVTAQSIPASTTAGYAAYLESRTIAPEQGDYYLGTDGAPAEAPGRWITEASALRALGVTSVVEVRPDELRALMAGSRPGSASADDAWLRPAGPDGSRAGGIDVTFSAPKSVSVVWAIANAEHRAQIEAAHHAAVGAALAHLRGTVATTVEWSSERRANVPALAADLHAAEFLHTTARGVAGAVPDPQLHSHVVITSVQRFDGAVAAVRSRPVLRAARELGAYYRASLAHELRSLGYAIESAGADERYFRIEDVPADVERAFSKRTEEVRVAAQRFRAEHGREPQRGELRSLAVRSRSAKLPETRGELDEAWEAGAREHGLTRADAERLRESRPAVERHEGWRAEVEPRLTQNNAIFDQRTLRTVALEQAAGAGIAPERALKLADQLCRSLPSSAPSLAGWRNAVGAVSPAAEGCDSGVTVAHRASSLSGLFVGIAVSLDAHGRGGAGARAGEQGTAERLDELAVGGAKRLEGRGSVGAGRAGDGDDLVVEQEQGGHSSYE